MVQRHACKNWTLYDYLDEAEKEDKIDEYMKKLFYEEHMDHTEVELSHRDRDYMNNEDRIKL